MAEAKLPSEELVLLKEESLTPPKETEKFLFPFTPYPIQVDFMRAIFEALEGKKLGIFESPTGTGKSLSLLCGSLTWLQEREEARLSYLRRLLEIVNIEEEEKKAKEVTDWISAQHELRQKREVVNSAKRELAFLETLQTKRKKYLIKKSTNSFSLNDQKYWSKKKAETGVEEKAKGGVKKTVEDELDDLLLNDDYAPEMCSDVEEEDKEEEPEFYPTRIIFASRTHSQIGQFAKELKRTEFAKKVTSCSLGSRQNLCINPEVQKLKNLSMMNERCLEIQKGSKGKKTSDTKKLKACNGCEFFNQSGIEELKSEILSTPMDIEELVSAGKHLNACPYYASRKASKEAQLVMLPYNSILHKSTREGIGIKTKNSVLLLDEAHNIIESISNMYSTSVNLAQLDDVLDALKVYVDKYRPRFSPKNLICLKQISHVVKSLRMFLSNPDKMNQHVFKIQEFKVAVSIENLDLYELNSFIKRANLTFKLKGYLGQRQRITEKTNELKELQVQQQQLQSSQKTSGKNSASTLSLNKMKNMKPQSQPKSTGTENKEPVFALRHQAGQSILNFVEFLKSLMTSHSSGRIIVEPKTKTLKFLLLSTSDHFTDLLTSARSIILAGGTMKPYDEVEDQLFQAAKERIYHFSCDHVIPDENLLCISLNHGPSNQLLDFTYQKRTTAHMMEELARTILNLSKIVPGGLVCFLPSYDYESTLYSFLKQSDYLTKLETKKKVFREPKDSSCDALLAEYTRQVKNCATGAMLLAVVGGKLSEGINFSDALGRCVLVVGLPYPNVTSVEVKEKVQYVSDYFGKEKGNQLLANMCSKAVNQSIGRAIRHSGDYAVIVLVDNRYSKPSQQALLPTWIQKRYQICHQFGPAVGAISKFFAAKRIKNEGA